MMKTYMKSSVRAALIVALLSASASAGRIDPPATSSGPGLGFVAVPAIIHITANNDNVPDSGMPDNNIVVPLKRFDSLGFIDIEFPVGTTGGVTEYAVSEFIDNNTGSNWSAYEMQLGFGTGGSFTLSTTGDGLDFDAPDYDPTTPTAAPFSTVDTSNEDILRFSGGTHSTGAQPYTFRIDVPDLPGGVTSFTLRQIPIPEPATVVLACMAFVGLAWRRSRD
jgi:hypothetical protein